VDEAVETKNLKRWCKKKTIVKMVGQAEGDYMTWDVPLTPDVERKVLAKHGKKVAEFVNKRFM